MYGQQATKSTSVAVAPKSSAPSESAALENSASGSSGDSSAVQDFLKYAKMNPFDRMRANILRSMNVTEADLQRMTPEQRSSVEQKIKEAIEREMSEKKGQQPGSLVDMSA
ncbi:hypothetical protein ACIPUD_36540 [Bradyrhizobium sp. CAR08]